MRTPRLSALLGSNSEEGRLHLKMSMVKANKADFGFSAPPPMRQTQALVVRLPRPHRHQEKGVSQGEHGVGVGRMVKARMRGTHRS